MGKPILISVVICTYNNADSLRITLRQLCEQQKIQFDLFEVIVVDNNSSDATAEVCASVLGSASLAYSYYFEARQGLSHARNTGVAAAKGEYILFTDDDADLPELWLANYREKIQASCADCLYSRIAVIWDNPQPWWYYSVYRPCFVELDYGGVALQVEDIHHEFFGKNFCIKKEYLVAQGGFDPTLGRMGDKLVAGEETLLYRSLVQNKRKLLYFPDAPVGHRLKAKEYTEEHIRKLFIDGAYSALRIARVFAQKQIFGRPFGLFVVNVKVLAQSIAAFLLKTIKGDRRAAFYHQLCMAKAVATLRLWVANK